MRTIQKFQINRKYYPSEKRVLLTILDRDTREVRVKAHASSSTPERVFRAQTYLDADHENGAYECFIYEGVRVPCTNLLPQGHPIRQLPPKERVLVEAAVVRDVKRRQKATSELLEIDEFLRL